MEQYVSDETPSVRAKWQGDHRVGLRPGPLVHRAHLMTPAPCQTATVPGWDAHALDPLTWAQRYNLNSHPIGWPVLAADVEPKPVGRCKDMAIPVRRQLPPVQRQAPSSANSAIPVGLSPFVSDCTVLKGSSSPGQVGRVCMFRQYAMPSLLQRCAGRNMQRCHLALSRKTFRRVSLTFLIRGLACRQSFCCGAGPPFFRHRTGIVFCRLCRPGKKGCTA
jgi:hypothetical protein